MTSPYEVLGIDADADDGEIERAYRRRVLETHPDHGGSAREFQTVREAYEAIVDGDGTVDVDRIEEGSDGPGEDGTGDVAGGSEAGGDSEGGADAAESEPAATVEYLDYERLTDHGWDLGDEDLFEKAAAADLPHAAYGKFLVQPGESLLEAAENRGFAWPYACRGGACANCAVAVLEGELSIPANNVLSEELIDGDIRLSCVGEPLTDELRIVFNVKHLPGLEELRLPPHPFDRARADD
ncbi:ferredoxin Fer [Halopenitus persicus]|uniref:Ferredoxin n=1 Tax=Halopenitus persicus TaxID=1048396 RepID=A0A1H3E004_9EURY|nr:ferredoxin Fer [Halopenitus persicus]QHS16440.1 2Fe-2S iron-sulfur cluster binding domain-containing protein [haloarchaeon 3A1-DGR]SDX71940.1 Ferredoxin [Halopenitus persicus]